MQKTLLGRPLTRRPADQGPAAIVGVVALFGWQAVSSILGDKAYLLPGPWQVAVAGGNHPALLLYAMATTLFEAFVGYAAAALVGILLAGAMSQIPFLRKGFYPYLVLLQTVPTIVIAPVIVLWFGYTLGSIMLISTLLAVAPIVNNSLAGFLATSRNLVDLFCMHRSSRWTIFWHLRFPAALPQIFAGLKTSAGLAVIGAIVGEFVIGGAGSSGGLGVQIIFAQGRFDTALLFAEVIGASLLGLLFFHAVSLFGDHMVSHWQENSDA